MALVRISDIANRVTALTGTERQEVVQDNATKYLTPEDYLAYINANGYIRRAVHTGITFSDLVAGSPVGYVVIPSEEGVFHQVVRVTYFFPPYEGVENPPWGGQLGLSWYGPTNTRYREIPETRAFEIRFLDDRGGIGFGHLGRGQDDGDNGNLLNLPSLVGGAVAVVFGNSDEGLRLPISDDPADATIVGGGTGYDDTWTHDASFSFPDTNRESRIGISGTAVGGVITSITGIEGRIWGDHVGEAFTVEGGNSDGLVSPDALASYAEPDWGPGLTIIVDYVSHRLIPEP
jgi:hypothetical protein